jgi:hypothetical protein
VLKQHLKSAPGNESASSIATVKSQTSKDIENALTMIREALDEDSDGNLEEAFELYTNAVEIYLKIVN